MQINKSTKINGTQGIQSENPTIETKPKLQMGVASTPDIFKQSSRDSSLSTNLNSNQSSAFVQEKTEQLMMEGQRPNRMKTYLNVLKQSISDMNEDKSDIVNDLAETNEASAQLSDALDDLYGNLELRPKAPDFPVQQSWLESRRAAEAKTKNEPEKLTAINKDSKNEERH
ncbi:hypothetical protein L0244_22265 [bacterium]|nr:hypothetical protein [bacterium]